MENCSIRNRVLSTYWNCEERSWGACRRTTKALINTGSIGKSKMPDTMSPRSRRCIQMTLCLYLRGIVFVAFATTAVWAGDAIPKAAWRRSLGLPLDKFGVTRVPGNIDDGFWQGAPVGGFGSGTFSRTYRGDFTRWHIKSGVHKYAPVYANQFAMFQQSEGESEGTARV